MVWSTVGVLVERSVAGLFCAFNRCISWRPKMDLKSALWALNGPPIGIALVRDDTCPEACVYVSVKSEK